MKNVVSSCFFMVFFIASILNSGVDKISIISLEEIKNNIKEIKEGKRNIMVFDLDYTLIARCPTLVEQMKEDYPDAPFILMAPWISELLETLKNAGYDLYIISKGNIESTNERLSLEQINLQSYFPSNNIRSSLETSKNKELEKIINELGGDEKIGHLMFVDDDVEEISRLKSFLDYCQFDSTLMHFITGDAYSNVSATFVSEYIDSYAGQRPLIYYFKSKERLLRKIESVLEDMMGFPQGNIPDAIFLIHSMVTTSPIYKKYQTIIKNHDT